MKNLLYSIVLLGIFTACNQRDDVHIQSISEDITSEEISKEISGELPGLSIYHLPATWTTQDNRELKLEELRGNVLVMVMIYTSCKTACPRLLEDMRNLERQVPEEDLDKVKFIIVSIDPETDTPQRLKEFSKIHLMEDDHWIFLRGTPEDTREFATVLAVNYKKISPMDFSHSNIISVFDEEGVLVHQKEGLGVDYEETVTAINEVINN